jgi:hypothetical protein
MEHAFDVVTARFFARRGETGRGPVQVVDAARAQTIALVNPGAGNDAEQWKWANRIARALCYESAGMARAHRAGAKGFAAGLLFGGVIMFAWMLGLGWQPASSCVDVGPYVAVPNG